MHNAEPSYYLLHLTFVTLLLHLLITPGPVLGPILITCSRSPAAGAAGLAPTRQLRHLLHLRL
eukprot:838857-Pelagomonas_calceolata.AAC.1